MSASSPLTAEITVTSKSEPPCGRPRIWMFPCTPTCLNMGDVAMLQVAVSRLRALWPSVGIAIPTDDGARLRRYCGEVTPLAYGDWFSDRYFLGRVHRFLPAELSGRLVQLKLRIRRRNPGIEERAIRLRMRIRGFDQRAFDVWAQAARSADALVVSGAGGIMDTFPGFTAGALRSLEFAILRGKPTALFSHGFGPLRSPDLLARAKAVLPRVDLIALRERRFGVPFLTDLGVDTDRVVVTGDDAIEIAYEGRSDHPGDGIGLNIRAAPSAAVKDDIVDVLRPAVHRFARQQGCPLVPLPIALQQRLDAANIDNLVRGYQQINPFPETQDTPAGVIKQVSRCRIVVTGAYHAAVFALAQGIPAVALARSPYFLDKFRGLRDIFDGGCEVVLLEPDNLDERLYKAMTAAWESADRLRAPLRNAASTQIEASQAAYRRFAEIVLPREPAASTRASL